MAYEIPFNVSSRQYQHEIGHHLRRDRLYDPDYGLSQDPHWYAKLEKDAVIGFLCRFRRHLVAGEEWQVKARTEDPKDKMVARIMQILLEEVGFFQESRTLLANAFLRGSAWARIGGRKKKINIPGLGRVEFWCVTQLKDVDKRRFDLRKDKAFKDKPLSEQSWQWTFSADGLGGFDSWQPIKPHHWVHHVYENTEQGLGWGIGLGGPLYFLHLLKSEAFTRNFQFMERWANGMLIAEIDQIVSGQVDETSLVRLREWVAVLEKMRSEHVIAHGKQDKVSVLDAPTSGHNAASELRDYADNTASRLILGSVLPTGGATDKGSMARAAVENDSTKALVSFDRNKLAETITESVIRLLWMANRATFEYFGLGEANLPRFKINFQENFEAAERAATAALLIENGCGDSMSKKQVIEVCGFRVADEGEETIVSKSDRDGLLGLDGEPGPEGDDGAASYGAAKMEISVGKLAAVVELAQAARDGLVSYRSARTLLGALVPGLSDEQERALIGVEGGRDHGPLDEAG